MIFFISRFLSAFEELYAAALWARVFKSPELNETEFIYSHSCLLQRWNSIQCCIQWKSGNRERNTTRKEISHNIRMSVFAAKSIIYLHFYFYFGIIFAIFLRQIVQFCCFSISVAALQRAIFASFEIRLYIFVFPVIGLLGDALSLQWNRQRRCTCAELRIVQDKKATTDHNEVAFG